MPQRRTDYKPKDMVRCHRCGRLCLKTSATKMNGVSYGPECLLSAFSAESEEDRIRRELNLE